MTFKAVIFDFDGTLVDSEVLHFHSWNTAILPYGIQLAKGDYFDHFAGVSSIGNAELILSRHKLPVGANELITQKEKATDILADSIEAPFMTGALETIAWLNEHNIPMSIVSGSAEKDVLRVVKKTKIGHYFQHIITKDQVTNNKPDPEGYLSCAHKMGFEISEYLVFEDTETGTLAAKKAGLHCFSVQHDSAYHATLTNAGANKIFDTMGNALSFIQQMDLITP